MPDAGIAAASNKPSRLTDAEFGVIKRHPVDGAEMVAALADPELTRIVRHHHERLDGAGYPDQLVGEEIPLGARIIAVADTFDAITSIRPYRAAAPHQKAIDVLRKRRRQRPRITCKRFGERVTFACVSTVWVTADTR